MKDVSEIKKKFFEKLEATGKTKNPLEMMDEIVNLTNWVATLYESGYKDGFEEGSSIDKLNFKDDFLNQKKN